PGVVEGEPADHRADVEGRLDRVELKLRAGNSGAVRYQGSRDDRPEQLGARGIRERLQATAERINQAVTSRLECFLALDRVAGDVVGDVDQDLVGLGTDIGNRC